MTNPLTAPERTLERAVEHYITRGQAQAMGQATEFRVRSASIHWQGDGEVERSIRIEITTSRSHLAALEALSNAIKAAEASLTAGEAMSGSA